MFAEENLGRLFHIPWGPCGLALDRSRLSHML
jgi:hypothetical protein